MSLPVIPNFLRFCGYKLFVGVLLFYSSPSAMGESWIYTFSGTIIGIPNDTAGLASVSGFGIGSKVSYEVLVDPDRLWASVLLQGNFLHGGNQPQNVPNSDPSIAPSLFDSYTAGFIADALPFSPIKSSISLNAYDGVWQLTISQTQKFLGLAVVDFYTRLPLYWDATTLAYSYTPPTLNWDETYDPSDPALWEAGEKMKVLSSEWENGGSQFEANVTLVSKAPSVVPEPSALALLAGMAGNFLERRRYRSQW